MLPTVRLGSVKIFCPPCVRVGKSKKHNKNKKIQNVGTKNAPPKLIPKSIICPLPFSWHPTTIRPWASDQNKEFPQGHRRAARKVTPAVTEAAAAATTAAAGTAVAAAAEL